MAETEFALRQKRDRMKLNDSDAMLNLGSVLINKQENVRETRPSSPRSSLQTGLSATPIYSRSSLGSRSSIGNNYIVTVTQGQKDIQIFSQNPDVDERGKVLLNSIIEYKV